MGVNLILPNGPSEEVLDGPSIGNGQWYRIGRIDLDESSSAQLQASAEFILSDGNSDRNTFIRLRASVCYPNSNLNSSLLLEEYACWSNPALSLMRMCRTSNGATLEIWGDNPYVANMRLRVRHEEFFPGLRWTPVNFEPIPVVPTDATVYMKRGIGPTGEFIPPTMQSGWINFDGGYNPTGYRMAPGSMVYLRGTIRSGTVGSAYPIFTLPPGHRPSYVCINSSICDSGMARIDVNPSGIVNCWTGSNGWLSLDKISFRAEN